MKVLMVGFRIHQAEKVLKFIGPVEDLRVIDAARVRGLYKETTAKAPDLIILSRFIKHNDEARVRSQFPTSHVVVWHGVADIPKLTPRKKKGAKTETK